MWTPEQWRRLEAVLRGARNRGPAERAAFLDEACGGDTALRSQIEALLDGSERESTLLETARELPVDAEIETARHAGDLTTHAGTPDEARDMVGARLANRYRLDARIGAGGMGVVYRAADLRSGGAVALKLLRGGELADPISVERFRREALAMTRLTHEHVVRVLDFGVDEPAGAFIVMELLEGCSLREALAERKRIPAAEALPLMRQICSAVAAVHDAGLIHRDLKPANVFLEVTERGPRARLLDFGIAKLVDSIGSSLTSLTSLTATGAFLGTPAYTPPEAWQGEQLDARSDVYSLGCLFYEILTGRPPFVSGRIARLMMLHTLEDPEPPSEHASDVTHAVEVAILRALAKDRTDRFAGAARLGKALDAKLRL